MEGVLRLQKNLPFSLSEPIYKFSKDFAYIRHKISQAFPLPLSSLPIAPFAPPKYSIASEWGRNSFFLGKPVEEADPLVLRQVYRILCRCVMGHWESKVSCQ